MENKVMGANVFSGGNLLLLRRYDHRFRQQAAFPNPTRSSSSLAFSITLISNNISFRQAIGGARARARARVLSSTVSDFYAPTQGSETYYDVLGVLENGTLSDVKKAYKQLARKYHPDVSPPDRTEEYTNKFLMVKEAYEMLSDPHARASYDLNLSRGFHFASPGGRRSNFSEKQSPIEAEEWRMRWKSQLYELGRMSMYKDSAGKASWGTRLRSRINKHFMS